jgi:hypothetical protein
LGAGGLAEDDEIPTVGGCCPAMPEGVQTTEAKDQPDVREGGEGEPDGGATNADLDEAGDGLDVEGAAVGDREATAGDRDDGDSVESGVHGRTLDVPDRT